MNRAALIDQIQQARETLEKLLTLLQSAPVERDRFVSHLYQSRREYRRACETAGKSGKQIGAMRHLDVSRSPRALGFKGERRSDPAPKAINLPSSDHDKSLLEAVEAHLLRSGIEIVEFVASSTVYESGHLRSTIGLVYFENGLEAALKARRT